MRNSEMTYFYLFSWFWRTMAISQYLINKSFSNFFKTIFKKLNYLPLDCYLVRAKPIYAAAKFLPIRHDLPTVSHG